ncbi:MAG: protein kinase [Sandaracinaceae bacterium]
MSFSHCPKTGHSVKGGRALVGQVVANRYRVLALLDEGGMGAVYVAEHLLIGRKVALKRLHPELTSDEMAVARFQREARAAAATGHEHIVEVLDLGFADDGAPFLVMEYLRGSSLAKLLDAETSLAPRRACRITGQVLAALDAVHDRGIVHRDLKPDNLFLTRKQGDTDFVKVVDFGISKTQPAEGETRMDLTRTGVMMGTPFYMSPEQARGVKQLDHRVDLFAAGVILYEMLTGTLPFDGENYHQLLQAILSGKHDPVQTRRRDLDPELAAVVERAIANRPDDRYQTAREMLTALVPFGAVDPGPYQPERTSRVQRFPSSDTAFVAPPSRSSNVSLKTPGRVRRASTPPVAPAPRPATPLAGMPLRSTKANGTPMPVRPRAAAPSGPEKRRSTPPSGDADRVRLLRESTPPWTGERTPKSRPRGKAALPVDLSGPPRQFVAHSANWQPMELVTPGLPREPRDSTPPPAVPARQASMTPSSQGGLSDIKGSLVLSVLEQLRRHGPDVPRRVAARLPTEVASRIAGVMLPMAWLPLSDGIELLRAAEREAGNGDGQYALRLGRAAAEHELATTHRLFMQSATPTMAVERIPKLFRTYHSSARVTVGRSTAGGFRLRVIGMEPDALVHALFLSGFYQRMLELAGGRDVRAPVVSCKERGDDATVTVLRWR